MFPILLARALSTSFQNEKEGKGHTKMQITTLLDRTLIHKNSPK